MRIDENIYTLTKLSSISIHNLDEQNTPLSSASGCIIKYKDTRFLLTVAHATGIKGRWGVQLEYDDQNKGIKYFIPQYSWLFHGKITEQIVNGNLDSDLESLLKDFEIIDFSYAILPEEYNPMDEFIDLEENIKYFRPKRVIETDLSTKLAADDRFSFYGHIRTEIDEQNKRLLLNEQYQQDIEFIGDFNQHFYRFKLPQTIKSIYDFKGCSGGPILNQDGELVSLVVAGYENTNILLGINLEKFKIALDVELDDFT
jgi:hypothetical protein